MRFNVLKVPVRLKVTRAVVSYNYKFVKQKVENMDFQIEERLRQIRKLKEESGEWISLENEIKSKISTLIASSNSLDKTETLIEENKREATCTQIQKELDDLDETMIPDEQRKWNTVLLDLDSVASFNERWKSRTPMARLNALHDVIHFGHTRCKYYRGRVRLGFVTLALYDEIFREVDRKVNEKENEPE